MTAKNQILNFMQTQKYGGIDWVAGGTLERRMLNTTAFKISYINRELRKMSDEKDPFAPLLKSEGNAIINGKYKKWIQYSLK